jgi:predicted CXXCH cytochrome family protein
MKLRVSRNVVLFGGITVWAGLLVSCVVVGDRTLMAPPFIAGATVVGSEACVKCHSNITSGFHDATHAQLVQKDAAGVSKSVSCESCHGPASLHVKAGTRETIINPKLAPDTCMQCHVNTRAEFNLPHTHPVMAGQVGCAQCHNPHEGDALAVGGTKSLIATSNAICAKCHPAQSGPFTFEHEAVREGCVTCHSPHGSVNDKMLKARSNALCYQCHFQPQSSNTNIVHGGMDHTQNVNRGTCWTAGCHEAVHGSHVNSNLRF